MSIESRADIFDWTTDAEFGIGVPHIAEQYNPSASTVQLDTAHGTPLAPSPIHEVPFTMSTGQIDPERSSPYAWILDPSEGMPDTTYPPAPVTITEKCPSGPGAKEAMQHALDSTNIIVFNLIGAYAVVMSQHGLRTMSDSFSDQEIFRISVPLGMFSMLVYLGIPAAGVYFKK